MKNKFIVIGIFLLINFIASCSYKLYSPVEQDLAWAKTRWADVDMAKLHRGKNYYNLHCGKCHGLKNPANYSEEEWKDIMPKMARKSKIADTTSNVIMTYLLTSAQGIKAQQKSK